MEGSLVKVADDARLEGTVLEGSVAIHWDLDRLKEGINRNLMKWNKDNAECWPWAGSTRARTKAGASLPASSFVGRELGAWADMSYA